MFTEENSSNEDSLTKITDAMTYSAVIKWLKTALPNQAFELRYEEQLEMVLEDKGSLESVLVFLRDDAKCAFTQLLDICAVDTPERVKRFDVVYHLLSMSFNMRIRIRLPIEEGVTVPSVVEVFSCANWFEREVWDMYGILFSSHPDLRRILTDYGFEGHPLRKDFPLTGHKEIRYDEGEGRVLYQPVSLDQNYRTYDMLSPWEGVGKAKEALLKQEAAEEEVGGGGSKEKKAPPSEEG